MRSSRLQKANPQDDAIFQLLQYFQDRIDNVVKYREGEKGRRIFLRFFVFNHEVCILRFETMMKV